MDFKDEQICSYCGDCSQLLVSQEAAPGPWRMLVCQECGHVDLFLERFALANTPAAINTTLGLFAGSG